MPPPRISSRPRTPVGSLWIVTLPAGSRLSGQLAFGRVILLFHFCPPLPKSKSSSGSFGQTSRTSRSVKSSPMKATSNPSNWASRTTLPSKISSGSSCASKFVQPFQSPVRFHLHRAQPGNFRAGQRERARKQRAKTGVAHEGRQMRRSFSQTQSPLAFSSRRIYFPCLMRMRRLAKFRMCGVARLICLPWT